MRTPMERPPGRTGGRESWAGGPDALEDTSRQLSIDDALAARDHGMETAEHATDIAWREACDRTIEQLADTGTAFTAEDVRRIVGAPVAASANAMGPRFMAASRRGVIEPAGWVTAGRTEAHGRPLRRWRGTR